MLLTLERYVIRAETALQPYFGYSTCLHIVLYIIRYKESFFKFYDLKSAHFGANIHRSPSIYSRSSLRSPRDGGVGAGRRAGDWPAGKLQHHQAPAATQLAGAARAQF